MSAGSQPAANHIKSFSPEELGDVNNNGTINILDALMTAQYYVGLTPSGFVPLAADVNGNGSVDILDALLIAQYYVGLITSFPASSSPTPTPVSVPPSPTPTPGWENLLGGRLTMSVELSGVGTGPEPRFWLHFKRHLSTNLPDIIWEVIFHGRDATGKYIYQAEDNWVVTDYEPPFVEHPDDWDNFKIGSNMASINDTMELQDIEILYEVAIVNGNAPQTSYIFVDTFNGPDIPDLPYKFPSLDPFIELEENIRQKREMEMERVVEEALAAKNGGLPIDIDFNNLPLNLREAAYDIGQSGNSKYAREAGGACNVTMGYYQMMYTVEWTRDFAQFNNTSLNDPDNGHFYIRDAPWPIAEGNNVSFLERGNPGDPDVDDDGFVVDSNNHRVLINRKLVRVNFTEVNAGGVHQRAGLDPVNPFVVVEAVENADWGVYDWNNTTEAYEPKPGDMFWRWDKCGGNSSIPHAMTLVTEPYFNGNTFVMSMFDGSQLSSARNYNEVDGANNSIHDEYITWPFPGPQGFNLQPDGSYVARNDNSVVIWPFNWGEDEDGNGIVDWGEYWFGQTKPVLPYKFLGINADTGRPMVLFCPEGEYFRYDYFVGETFHPEEWYVSTQGTGEWNRIGENILKTPIGPALRNPTADPALNNPVFADLSFYKFDSDNMDDVFWKAPDNSWQVSYSEDVYNGWHRVNQLMNPVDLLFGDFGNANTGRVPDGHTDIMQIQANGSTVILQVSYWTAKNQLSSSWTTICTFNGTETAQWYYNRMRVADFNGDGLSDVFFHSAANYWIIFDAGHTLQLQKLTDNTSVSELAFVDVTEDEKLDVIRIVQDSVNGWKTWEYCRWNSFTEYMDDWAVLWQDYSDSRISYQLNAANNELRFVNMNSDPRTDVLYRKGPDEWYVWDDMIAPCSWRRIYPDTQKTLSEIGFGNFINITADGNIPRTDFFTYMKSVIRG